MSHVNVELQTFIFTLLNTDASLLSLGVTGVYDKVPDNQEYPYIRFESIDASDWDNHSSTGFAGSMTIKAFDRSDSSLVTKQIQSRIYELLHDGALDLPSFKKINFRCTLTNDTIENDSRTRNGTQNFDFIFARK